MKENSKCSACNLCIMLNCNASFFLRFQRIYVTYFFSITLQTESLGRGGVVDSALDVRSEGR